MVSESLRGVISQQLVPRIDGKGRVLALEILTNTPAVANVIREAKTFMLPGIIQTGRKQGMRLMDDSLIELFDQGLSAGEEAYARAEEKAMRKHLNKDEAKGDEKFKRSYFILDSLHQLRPCPTSINFSKSSSTPAPPICTSAKGQPPKIRRHGDVIPIRERGLTRDEAAYMMSEICGPERWERFEETGDLDFAYEMDEHSRFRCNFLKQTNGYGAVFRLIPTKDRHARAARHPAGRQGIRPSARRPRPRHRPDRLGQIDDARGADRLHQHELHRGTSSRSRSRSSSCTRTRRASSPSAKCRSIPELLRGLEGRAARGRGHRARRRNARLGNHLSSRSPPRRPACSSSARCTPTTRARPSTA